MAELDPRWDWTEIAAMGQRGPTYIKGRCNHLEIVPVTVAWTGEEVAALCVTCDTALPAGTRPDDPRAAAVSAELEAALAAIAVRLGGLRA